MSVPKISLSLGAGRKASAPTNGVKRPRAALHEDDDDHEELGQTETVSHFDKTAGGAVDASRKQEDTGPLIIPKQTNRDWKEAANRRKRQKSGLPEGAGRGQEGLDQRMAEVEAAVEAAKPGFGLNTYNSKAAETNGEAVLGDADAASKAMDAVEKAQQLPPEPDAEDVSLRKRTEDELARDALLGHTTDTSLVLPALNDPVNEGDAFKNDYNSAPPMASLDDYARVPVEQFGAALLRGMGWKDGEGVGSQRGVKLAKNANKVPTRRAALLGIGAKEDAAIAGEMGAWGKAAKGKDAKIYNPVLLKDKRTGEMFTEEELKLKKEKEERELYEMEFEKKEKERRRADRNGGSDERDRRRDKDEGRRRDRSRDRDRDKRKYDSESEEERQRRKDKERRRRREHERDGGDERDRDRHRSRRDEGDRHRDRDRDHRHDRDRDRRR
ncbi:unnamed protein product [Zymoseptoria tritici ST99CH_3D7]|uniref:Pre-mRNA-splicing factor n=1 Tax=Zymoseptoria tritici (strain ST99CH_3D7) TaxID=1276538 RepID=A0A1X7RY23_ZYMT9|nr:unnamed protein product [Zymoseptoria tritici ST99CH_3D7]